MTRDFSLFVLILFAKPNLVFYQFIHLVLYFLQKSMDCGPLPAPNRIGHFPSLLLLVPFLHQFFFNNPQWNEWSAGALFVRLELQKHMKTCLVWGTVVAASAGQRAENCRVLGSPCVIPWLPEGGRASKHFWVRMGWHKRGLVKNGQNLFKRALACLRFAKSIPESTFSLCRSWH